MCIYIPHISHIVSRRFTILLSEIEHQRLWCVYGKCCPYRIGFSSEGQLQCVHPPGKIRIVNSYLGVALLHTKQWKYSVENLCLVFSLLTVSLSPVMPGDDSGTCGWWLQTCSNLREFESKI